MTQMKHTIQDTAQPVLSPTLLRHSQGHISYLKRHKTPQKNVLSFVKQSQSLVEQALELADELSPLPDDWDYKNALADAILQRHGEA